MNFSEITDAILIGFVLAFMIGPVFFILIQTSVVKGARAAIAFDLGVIIADITFITIAYYGSKKLLEQLKDDPRLFFVGGLILIVYGLITYLDKRLKRDIEENNIEIPVKNNYLKLVTKGFLINFINIGVLAFWLGLIVVVGPNLKMEGTKIFHFFGVVLLTYLLVDIGKIVLAKQLKRKLTPGLIYRIKRTMGIVLIIFGFFLLLKGFIPNNQIF